MSRCGTDNSTFALAGGPSNIRGGSDAAAVLLFLDAGSCVAVITEINFLLGLATKRLLFVDTRKGDADSGVVVLGCDSRIRCVPSAPA